MAVEGLSEVLNNLNKQIRKIKSGTNEGLVAAGLFIKAESQEITPVQFGVLVNSAFTRPVAPFRVVVGYTAEYAPYVHEAPEELDWTKPGTGNKFLEKAVKNNLALTLKIIHNRAKL